jgi:hypothetical protein
MAKQKKATKKTKATKPAKAKTKVAAKPKAAKKAKTKPAKTTSTAIVLANKPFEPTPAPKKSVIEKTAEIDNDEEFEHEPVLETIEKASFIGMCDVLHALSHAFRWGEDEDPSDRFLAAWHGVLAIGGWNEDQFWESYHSEAPCPECGCDMDDEEELPMLTTAPDRSVN